MNCLKICPRCCYVNKPSDDPTTINCQWCGTKMIETEYGTNQYQEQARNLRLKYRNNPLYDKEAHSYWLEQEILKRTGEESNLSQTPPTLTTCPVCQGKVSTAATACPHCGQPLQAGKAVTEQPRPAARPTQVDTRPKCPTCGSTNVDKIGMVDRATSVAFWGIFSSKINKTMQCRNCGYKW